MAIQLLLEPKIPPLVKFEMAVGATLDLDFWSCQLPMKIFDEFGLWTDIDHTRVNGVQTSTFANTRWQQPLSWIWIFSLQIWYSDAEWHTDGHRKESRIPTWWLWDRYHIPQKVLLAVISNHSRHTCYWQWYELAVAPRTTLYARVYRVTELTTMSSQTGNSSSFIICWLCCSRDERW